MSLQAHPKNEAELNNGMNCEFATLEVDVSPVVYELNVGITELVVDCLLQDSSMDFMVLKVLSLILLIMGYEVRL